MVKRCPTEDLVLVGHYLAVEAHLEVATVEGQVGGDKLGSHFNKSVGEMILALLL